MINKENKSISYFLSVAALLLINFGFFPMSGGEEQYMGLTAQWANPDWIKDSFTFTEFPGTRLIFQYLTAPFISVLGIEYATFFLRILTLILAAWPLSKLLKHIKIPLIIGLLALQIFFSLGQNLFGGEWIVNTFEPKAVAYLFGLMAVLKYADGKYLTVAVLLALSTYFHFLIGGWILVVLGMLMLLNKKWIISIKSLVLYLLLLSPFVVYLFNGYFGGDVSAEQSAQSSWIYCYYRLPHHTGIFSSYKYFMEDSLIGVLLTMAALVISIRFYNKAVGIERKLTSIIIAAFGMNLLFVVAAWVDGILLEQRASFLIKYYPFRTNSIALLLFILLSLKQIINNLITLNYWSRMKYLPLAVLVVLAFFRVNTERKFALLDMDKSFDLAAKEVSLLTEKDAIIAPVAIPLYNGRLNRFSRLSERELIATLKFTPAEPEKTLEWFERIKVSSIISLRPSTELKNHKDTYQITHLISSEELLDMDITELYSNDHYKIYKIND